MKTPQIAALPGMSPIGFASPKDALRHHVSGAIDRGEAVAIVEIPVPGPDHPLVEHWDDERGIGNGIIVTLIPGKFFYDDCGVMGFDTVREAKAEVTRIAKRYAAIAKAEGR